MLKRVYVFLLLIFLQLTQSPFLYGSSDTAMLELNEDDLLVVQLSYQTILLDEALFVYRTPDSTLIPVQSLFDALDFPLKIDVDAQTIDGWFITESSRFSLDIYNQTVFVEGQAQPWPKNFHYAMDGFDLYINLRTLEQWFNLKLNMDVSQLSLSLESEQVLPFIQKKQREIEREKIAKRSTSSDPKNYIANEYDWLGQPGVDIELNYDLERYDPKGDSSSTNHFSGAVMQGNMDLLKHSMNSSYVNQDGEEDLRITFSRSAEGPDKSMLFGVDAYEFGDISSHSDTLLFGSASGSGVHIKRGKNALLEQSTDILIEGDAPPGWEVELYRNGTLVNFTSPSPNGQYQFENIATFMGENIFDVRIYGPQGQFRTRQKRISVGANMISKGEWEYQLYGLKKNNNLIQSKLNSGEESSDFFYSDMTYGVNEYLTFQTGFNQMTPVGTDIARQYAFLSLFTSLEGSLAQLKMAYDKESGSAFASSFKGRWLETNYNIDLLKYNHLISDRSPNGQLKLDAKFRANGLFRFFSTEALSYDVEIRHTEHRVSNIKQLQISKRLGARLGHALISHSLGYNHSNSDGSKDTLDSNLSATRRWESWRLKAELNYSIQPNGRLQSINTSATYQESKSLTFQTGLNYERSGGDVLAFSNILTWNFQSASLSITAGFDNEDRQFMGLSLSTSLAYDNAKQTFLFDKDGESSSASVLAHAYVDENNNDHFDENEIPVEGVVFVGKNSWKNAPTDANGYTTLYGVPSLNMQRISVDERSVEDPYMKVKRSSYYLYSHAGKQTELSFQLVPTLEIEGQIYIESNDRQQSEEFSVNQALTTSKEDSLKQSSKLLAKSGVPVALFTLDGELIAETSSEYDGIYLFENILPGKYRLRVDHLYLEKHKLSSQTEVEIEVIGNEGVFYVDQMLLQKIPENPIVK